MRGAAWSNGFDLPFYWLGHWLTWFNWLEPIASYMCFLKSFSPSQEIWLVFWLVWMSWWYSDSSSYDSLLDRTFNSAITSSMNLIDVVFRLNHCFPHKSIWPTVLTWLYCSVLFSSSLFVLMNKSRLVAEHFIELGYTN